jgi:hypothetical protein
MLKHLAQAFYVSLGLHEMLLEGFLQFRVVGCFGHLWQRAGQLTLGVEKVL